MKNEFQIMESISTFYGQSSADNKALQDNSLIFQILSKMVGGSIILLGGLTGSGKTTFARDLQAHLGDRIVIFSGDHYYMEQKDAVWTKDTVTEIDLVNFANPNSFKMQLFVEHIDALISGYAITPPVDAEAKTQKVGVIYSKTASPVFFNDNQVLIIDSVHSLNPEVIQACKDRQLARIALYAPPLFRLFRRIIRDHLDRGTPPQETIKHWLVILKEAQVSILPYYLNADIILHAYCMSEWCELRKNIEKVIMEVLSNESLLLEERKGFEKHFKTVVDETLYIDQSEASWIETVSQKLPFKINCFVQNYNWGDLNFIYDLLGQDNPDQKPAAELWVGAHNSLPAMSKLNNDTVISLNRLIEQSPESVLGSTISKIYDNQLPYMLKVFAVKRMTSLHVHPNKVQAKQGYENESASNIPLNAPNRNFKDKNHRPELFIAVTDVYRFVGFRALPDVLEAFRKNEELQLLLPNFEDDFAVADNDLKKRHLLKKMCKTILTMHQDKVDEILRPLVKCLSQEHSLHPFAKSDREYWVLEADKQQTENGHLNRGAIFFYLLELVFLKPEQEAFYIPTGIPHVHLEGVSIEMAPNTDCITRGALTSKHVDVSGFLNLLNYECGGSYTIVPEAISKTETLYPSPAEEFGVSLITVTSKLTHINTDNHSADTLLIWEGNVILRTINSEMTLKKGDIVIVPASTIAYEISGDGRIYRAFVPMLKKR